MKQRRIGIGIVFLLLISATLLSSGCTERKEIVYVDRETGREVPAPVVSYTERDVQRVDEASAQSQSIGGETYRSSYMTVYRNGNYDFVQQTYKIYHDGFNNFVLPDAAAYKEDNQVEIRMRFKQDTTLDQFKWQVNEWPEDKNEDYVVPEVYEDIGQTEFQNGEVIKVITFPDPAATAGRTFLLSGYNDGKEKFVVECGVDENGIVIEKVFNPKDV